MVRLDHLDGGQRLRVLSESNGTTPLWVTAEIAGASLAPADARAVLASIRFLDKTQ
jgi:hypothetical protein